MSSVPLIFAQMCRACMSWDGEMRNIFQDAVMIDDTVTNINNMVLTCVGIEVNQLDGLPIQLCDRCVIQISSAFSFRKLCERTEATLQQIIKGELTLEMDEVTNMFTTKMITKNEEFNSLEVKNEFSAIDSYDELTNDSNTFDKLLILNDKIKLLNEDIDTESNNEKGVSSVSNATHFDDKSAIMRFKKRNGISSLNKNQTIRKPLNKCKICGRHFKLEKHYNEHVKSHEVIRDKDIDELQCEICHRKFFDLGCLTMHTRSHRENKKFKCQECGRLFYYETNLKKHMQIHTPNEEKSLKCQICNRGFIRNNSLIIHMKSHKPTIDKRHCCTECPKEFSQRGALNIHLLKHTGEKSFLCNECGKKFFQLHNLQQHLLTHRGEKPHQCTNCNKYFATTSSLKNHMRTHSGNKPFVCDTCGKDFIRSADLVIHKNFHLGIKPIQCLVCPRRLATTSHFSVHMRTHTGEKPYICNVCNRAFGARSTLRKHLLTHTGEKPHICTVCGRAFSQTGSLATHMKTHGRKY